MKLKNLEEKYKKIIQKPVINQITQIQFTLRIAEIIHHLTYEKRDTRMAAAMVRYKTCKDCQRHSANSLSQLPLSLCR